MVERVPQLWLERSYPPALCASNLNICADPACGTFGNAQDFEIPVFTGPDVHERRQAAATSISGLTTGLQNTRLMETTRTWGCRKHSTGKRSLAPGMMVAKRSVILTRKAAAAGYPSMCCRTSISAMNFTSFSPGMACLPAQLVNIAVFATSTAPRSSSSMESADLRASRQRDQSCFVALASRILANSVRRQMLGHGTP
jgi:hypothetical protein